MSALGILGAVSLGFGVLLLALAILGIAHCQEEAAISKLEHADDLFFSGILGFFAGIVCGLRVGVHDKNSDLFHASLLACASIGLIVAGGLLVAL